MTKMPTNMDSPTHTGPSSGTSPTAASPRTTVLPIFHADFDAAARQAIADLPLRSATAIASIKKDNGRRALLADLPDSDALRTLAGQIKAHTLDRLDYYLEQLESNIIKAGVNYRFNWASPVVARY